MLLLLTALPAFGQAGPGGGGGFGGGPGGGGGYGGGGGGGFGGGGGGGGFNNGQPPDPAMIQQFVAAMQQRVMDNVKAQLGTISDDEFTALQPYILRVLQLQFSSTVGRLGGMRIGGQNLGALLNAGQPPSDLQTASTELQAAIDDTTTTPGTMEGKLAAFRAARQKANDDMTVAQENLRQLLTERQEASLVVMGLLP